MLIYAESCTESIETLETSIYNTEDTQNTKLHVRFSYFSKFNILQKLDTHNNQRFMLMFLVTPEPHFLGHDFLKHYLRSSSLISANPTAKRIQQVPWFEDLEHVRCFEDSDHFRWYEIVALGLRGIAPSNMLNQRACSGCSNLRTCSMCSSLRTCSEFSS